MSKGKRRTFDREFKIEAVRLVAEKGRSVAEVARNLGIHPNSLFKWKRDFLEDKENSFPGKGNLKPEDEELRRLRRENAELREERDILKKATAFFAKNSE
jgi:transposase